MCQALFLIIVRFLLSSLSLSCYSYYYSCVSSCSSASVSSSSCCYLWLWLVFSWLLFVFSSYWFAYVILHVIVGFVIFLWLSHPLFMCRLSLPPLLHRLRVCSFLIITSLLIIIVIILLIFSSSPSSSSSAPYACYRYQVVHIAPSPPASSARYKTWSVLRLLPARRGHVFEFKHNFVRCLWPWQKNMTNILNAQIWRWK